MNERIKELSLLALDYAEKNHSADQHWFKAYNENFAELIVRECALQCVHNEDMDLIEKHFGVEE